MSWSCVTVQLVSIQWDGRFGRLYIFVSDESLLDDGYEGLLCLSDAVILQKSKAHT